VPAETLIHTERLEVEAATFVEVVYLRNRRARRYILRVQNGSRVRVSLPWRGSLAYAQDFVRSKFAWLRCQLKKRVELLPSVWSDGMSILFRGEFVTLHVDEERFSVRLGEACFPLKNGDVKGSVQRGLMLLAKKTLPERTLELAAIHGLKPDKVRVRNQRTRWGSCSRGGTISLNWRLIQAPFHVVDYLILHELAHMPHPNHSRSFWKCVEVWCPSFRDSEAWLKTEGRRLIVS